MLKIEKVLSGQYSYVAECDGYVAFKGTLPVKIMDGSTTHIHIALEKDLLNILESELNGKVLLARTEKGMVSQTTNLQDVYLVGAPKGLDINSIQYVDDQSFLLELSYQGDMDADVKNVSVFIKQKSLLRVFENRSIKTGMAFNILAEDTIPGEKKEVKAETVELVERYVNKACIVLKLSGSQFSEEIGLDDLKAMGLPRGIDLKEIRYIDESTIYIRLYCGIDLTEAIENIQFVLLAGGMKNPEVKEIIQLGKLSILRMKWIETRIFSAAAGIERENRP